MVVTMKLVRSQVWLNTSKSNSVPGLPINNTFSLRSICSPFSQFEYQLGCAENSKACDASLLKVPEAKTGYLRTSCQ